MILPFLLLLQAAPGVEQGRYDACVKLIAADASKAAAVAEAWRNASGGVPARQCLGLAYAAQALWPEAAAAFEQAATDAETQRDGRAGTLWSQAGNAALAGGDPARARGFLDRALALSVLTAAYSGEALLDRGRADVALADMSAARRDIDAALGLVPADPMAWLLSATLARRESDVPRARRDIAKAVLLAGDDAAVLYEAGNVAFVSGDTAGAAAAWRSAAGTATDTPARAAAKAALAAMPAP